MEYSPGLDVGDDPLDCCAQTVDDCVVGFDAVAEFGALGLLCRADDLASLVALVADGVAGGDAGEDR